MFKLALLLAVVAVASAEPNALLPLGYSGAVVPGVSSVSAYSTGVVHPNWYGSAGLYGAGYPLHTAPIHHLGKRSLGYGVWPAVSYANPVVAGYGATWGYPAYGHGYGYGYPLYPRAHGVHAY